VNKPPFLSIVIPILNESQTLLLNLSEISKNVSRITSDFEIILVDDGSSDDSWTIISEMSRSDPRFSGIRFSRNYGKESAIFAGLERTNGNHILVMDSDLQHPPSAIPDMVKHYLENDLDVLDGVKRSRAKESTFYRIAAASFYNMFAKFCGMDLRRSSDFKILSRQVVNDLVRLNEYSLFFRGLSAWVGFKHGCYEFDVDDRKADVTKWSVSELFKLGINAITSYTSSPLHLVSIIGLLFLFFAFVLGLQTLYNKLSGASVDGFTTVILLLLVIGAAIMISLGIMGQYLAKIYDEAKGRPRFIIKDETKNQDGQ